MAHWRYRFVFAVVMHFGAPLSAETLRLTGISVYTGDELGNPSGHETFSDQFFAHYWRTFVAPGSFWYGLGVLPELADGTPPLFLNAADFTVDLPLKNGEHELTLLAEPGVLTATDAYDAWVLNLYFDDDPSRPGIMAVVPRFGDPQGSPPMPSRANSDQIYSLYLERAGITTPPFVYENQGTIVSVKAFSFVLPNRQENVVDHIGPRSFGRSGVNDAVGVLTLSVERQGDGGGCAVSSSPSQGGWLAGALPLLLLVLRLKARIPLKGSAATPLRVEW